MKKVSLIIHHQYIEEVIQRLHETGIMEIINISKEEAAALEQSEKAMMHPEAGVCTTYELRLARLIDILKNAQPKSKGFKALLHPKTPEIRTVEKLSLEELYSQTEGVLSSIEKQILACNQRIQQLDEEITQLETYLNQLTYLLSFDFSLSDLGTSEYLTIKAGKTTDFQSLTQQVQQLEKTVLCSKQFGRGKKTEWAVVLIAHNTEKKQIEQLCRDHLQEFDLPLISQTPKEAVTTFKQQIDEKNNEKQNLSDELLAFTRKQLPDLLALKEQLHLERMRKEIPNHFAKTDATYVIQGWVLEKQSDALQSMVTEVTEDHAVVQFQTPSMNPDDPPTYIETPSWAKSFQTLVKLFAVPKYNEIDPTVIMGLFFIVFFGVMLGDAGYGLVIFLLSLIGFIKFAKHSPMIKNWAFMGIWLGIVTTLVGVLTNSFFGDFIPRFIYGDPTKPIYVIHVGGITLPVEPLKDPLTILVIALIFGLIHLNVGIILGLYQAFKRKQYRSFLTERLCWIPLQIGGGLLIGYFILDWQISTPLFFLAVILIIIGMIQLFISAGPVGFFDITGYVGDWLSYARLLALGLATAGMALAFNVVAGLLPDMIPLIGIVLLPIILIFAHIANLALQALGAGVHSLRLQYVEFFNRFYEGGGHEFTPFKIKRKYTKLQDEEIE